MFPISTGILFIHPTKYLLLHIKLPHILSYQILLPIEYYSTAVLAKFIQHFSAVLYLSNFLPYKIIHLKLRTCPFTILYTFTRFHPSWWAPLIYIFTTWKKKIIEVKIFYFLFYFLFFIFYKYRRNRIHCCYHIWLFCGVPPLGLNTNLKPVWITEPVLL